MQTSLSSARRPRANFGPYGSEEQALAELVRRLVDALDPQMIWLVHGEASL